MPHQLVLHWVAEALSLFLFHLLHRSTLLYIRDPQVRPKPTTTVLSLSQAISSLPSFTIHL